ncbi:MAG: prepilin-type N-terminal cleavage/methylation domain-containing protein [Gammaproteobacteria bacterium]|nr:prepilin-type N-terminal cleavage/methylation domain-containing protein [Pseudomonadota bacterium]TDJ32099.1 MAG: prepilin-type N-terminal cleavage/methylation domain-containing protein [Gammaproteobacteria bacterium]
MATPRSLKGFSLLEMLVAITVLSMVIGISTYAYSLFMRQWDGHLGRFDEAQAQYQRLDWLASALEDTLPYIVRDDNGVLGFYFLGREEGLTAVTMSPIFDVGEPALIRVFREADDSGAWRLVYEEAPFAGNLLARADQRMDFRHRLIIARNVPHLKFRYFGWADLQTRMSFGEALNVRRSWFDEFDGLQRQFHPEKIELNLGGDAAVFDIPVRADALIQAYAEPE